MVSIAAGELNKRITLQSLSQTQDSEGGMVDSWTDFATVWAKIINLSGFNKRSSAAAGGNIEAARTEFTIRYNAGVNKKMRIVYKGQNFNIDHLNDFNEQHVKMILTSVTGLNDGR